MKYCSQLLTDRTIVVIKSGRIDRKPVQNAVKALELKWIS